MSIQTHETDSDTENSVQHSTTQYNTPHTTHNSKLQAQAGKRILMLHI